MKIFKKLMLVIALLLILPMPILADCSVKMYRDYKVKVSNLNGAVSYTEKYENDQFVYKKDKIIPYGTVLYLRYDVGKFGDDYLLYLENEENHTLPDIEFHRYYIKASDLSNVEEFKIGNKTMYKSSYYVIKDTEVRSGPGMLYDVVGTIKKDTNIMIDKPNDSLNFGREGSEPTGTWIYITDGNVSGYVYYELCDQYLEVNVAKKVENIYWAGPDDNEYGFKFGDKVNAKYALEFKNERIIVDIDGEYYNIDVDYFVEKYDHNLRVLDLKEKYISLTDLEERGNSDSVSKLELLEKNKEYKVLYRNLYPNYFDTYYIEINGQIYVLSTDYPSPVIVDAEPEELKVNSDYYYGFDPNLRYSSEKNYFDSEKTIEVYKPIDDLDKYYDFYYSDEYGYIYLDNEKDNTKNENITSEKDNTENEDIIILDNNGNKSMMIKYLIGSVVLASIVTVVLIIINKKKNKK